MKAVITDRIYLTKTPELIEKLDLELVYKFKAKNNPEAVEIYRDIRTYNENIISIPVGRMDLIPKDYKVLDKRTFAPTSFPTFNFDLRTHQQPAIDEIDDSYVLKAYTGSGKTVMGAFLAKKFGQKTLVVVHSKLLLYQWAASIKEIAGINVGIIGDGKFNLDAPIVIGTVQTLRNRIPKIRKEFGTVILDEVQYVAATTFKTVIDKMCARYKIGMSATLNRKDGKGILIKDYFSTNLFTVADKDKLTPTVIMIPLDIKLDSRPTIPWATKLNKLYENPEFMYHVVALTNTMAQMGRNVLTVADRVEFLREAAELSEEAVAITGSVVEREELLNQFTNTYHKLYGTTSIFKEGFNEEKLDTIILATPINNDAMLEQLAGRVIRPHPDKYTPTIVDLCFDGPLGKKQMKARRSLYRRLGYNIIEFIEDYDDTLQLGNHKEFLKL